MGTNQLRSNGGLLDCCKTRTVLLGQDPVACGAVIVVVPAGRKAVGSAARKYPWDEEGSGPAGRK